MNIQEVLAHLSGSEEADKINERYNSILRNFDKIFSQHPVIRSEEDYLACSQAKSTLCSLSCYTANTNHPDNDKVWDMEGVYGKAMEKYNRKILIKDKEAKIRARYLIWNYSYQAADQDAVLRDAAADGILVKKTEAGITTQLYVVGLCYKVGDNTFRVDSKGREHRRYVNTVGRQAILVNLSDVSSFVRNHPEIMDSIPELDDSYYTYSTGNGKNMIKEISFRHEEREYIIANYIP